MEKDCCAIVFNFAEIESEIAYRSRKHRLQLDDEMYGV